MVKFNFAVSDLTDRVKDATAAVPAIPVDWNGSLGSVDIAKPSDYTGDLGKICLNTANAFHLGDTLAYYAWVVAGKPTTPAPADLEKLLTDDFAKEYFELAAEAIARERIYHLFYIGDLDIAYRLSDRAIWPPTKDIPDRAERAAVVEFFDRVAAFTFDEFVGDEAKEIALIDPARMVLFNILACAIHRALHEDHSWFTKEMKNPKSPTSKCVSVAGSSKKEFLAYQTKRGHDSSHHLSTATIDAMAKVLANTEDMMADNAKAGTLQYMGAPIAGRNIRDVLNIGGGAEKRYPPGILGTGAAITGLELGQTMIVDMSIKVLFTNHEPIATNMVKVAERLKVARLNHQQIVHISNALTPALAFIWGYVEEAGLNGDVEYLALKNHAKRNDAMRTAGIAVAKAMRRVRINDKAIQGTLVAQLCALSEAITAAGSVNLAAAGAPAAPLVSDFTRFNPGGLTAEVGTKKRSDSDEFQDANS